MRSFVRIPCQCGGRAKPRVWPINGEQTRRYLARNTVIAKPVGDDETVLPAKDDHAITFRITVGQCPEFPDINRVFFFELKLTHKKQTVNEIIFFDIVLQTYHRLVGSRSILSSQCSAQSVDVIKNVSESVQEKKNNFFFFCSSYPSVEFFSRKLPN